MCRGRIARAVTGALLVGLGVGCGSEERPGERDAAGLEAFDREVAYSDTIAIVGGDPIETNPLFLYEQPNQVRLIGESTVVFGDEGGNLTVVDLTTGEGWSIEDSKGDGPGEMRGRRPLVAESDGTLHTATEDRRWARRSTSDGSLIDEGRYPEWGAGPAEGWLRGPLRLGASGTVVFLASEFPLGKVGDIEIASRIDVFGPEGHRWRYDLPPVLWRFEREGNGIRAGDIDGGTPSVVARGETVVVTWQDRSGILVLDLEGNVLADQDLGLVGRTVAVDREDRIWVGGPDGLRVYSRLLEPLFRTHASGMMDARGKRMLVMRRDSSTELVQMVLLEAPALPGT